MPPESTSNVPPAPVPVQPETPKDKPNGLKTLFTSKIVRGAIVLGIVALIAVIGWYVWTTYGIPSYTTNALKSADDAFNNNNINEAIRQAAALAQKDPKNIDALIHTSIFLSQKGSTEFKEKLYGGEAVTYAQNAIKLDPKNSEAWRALGYAYEIMQNYPEAHKDYATALSYDKQNVNALFSNAHVYDLEGNTVLAQKGYQQAIDTDLSFAPARAGLARILLQQNNRDGALKEFLTAYGSTKNKHEKAEAAYSISQVYLVEQKFTDAQKYAEEATVLDPAYPLGWYGAGAVYFAEATQQPGTGYTMQQRAALLTKSSVMMNDAIKLNPNQSAAYLQLAIDFSFIGQFQTVFEILDKAQSVVPSDSTLTANEKVEMIKRIQEVRDSYKFLSTKTPPKK